MAELDPPYDSGRQEPALAPVPATSLQSWQNRSRSGKEGLTHESLGEPERPLSVKSRETRDGRQFVV